MSDEGPGLPELRSSPRGADHPSGLGRFAPAGDDDRAGPPLLAAAYPPVAGEHGAVSYGPDIADERELRLLGHVRGKRVLELGAAGHHACLLAQQGAHVIVVDPSHRRLERVRQRCEAAEVRAELHQSDPAELAFLRADTVDLALGVFTLASAEDLDRVFRQVHRVLRPDGPLVLSLPHPALAVALGGSYFDDLATAWRTDDAAGRARVRTVAEVFAGLTRANFRVDTLLEPEPPAAPRSGLWVDAMARAPATLILRARKLGA